MLDTPSFLIALGVAGGSAAAVVAALALPLYRVVVDLCGTTDRARFWTTYVCILIILAPVLAVSFAGSFSWVEKLSLQTCVFWSATALLIALGVIGLNLRQFALRQVGGP